MLIERRWERREREKNDFGVWVLSNWKVGDAIS